MRYRTGKHAPRCVLARAGARDWIEAEAEYATLPCSAEVGSGGDLVGRRPGWRDLLDLARSEQSPSIVDDSTAPSLPDRAWANNCNFTFRLSNRAAGKFSRGLIGPAVRGGEEAAGDSEGDKPGRCNKRAGAVGRRAARASHQRVGRKPIGPQGRGRVPGLGDGRAAASGAARGRVC